VRLVVSSGISRHIGLQLLLGCCCCGGGLEVKKGEEKPLMCSYTDRKTCLDVMRVTLKNST
jgi:hypothetical protein